MDRCETLGSSEKLLPNKGANRARGVIKRLSPLQASAIEPDRNVPMYIKSKNSRHVLARLRLLKSACIQ
jgi:hypothetical protein